MTEKQQPPPAAAPCQRRGLDGDVGWRLMRPCAQSVFYSIHYSSDKKNIKIECKPKSHKQMDKLCEQIHKKGHHIKWKLNYLLEEDHDVKCTTFATVPLTNHFGFNWKKFLLCCNPLVLVWRFPWPCKLMLNIDSMGCWDLDACSSAGWIFDTTELCS